MDGEDQERRISAGSKAEAEERFLAQSGIAGNEVKITELRRVAGVVADNSSASPDQPAGERPDQSASGRSGQARQVAAVISGGLSRLDFQARRRRPVWPQKGDPLDGVRPGEWRAGGDKDDTGQLPKDCPVKPLGYEGENFFFVDTLGQVFNSGDKALGVERMQKLFSGQEDFLCWAWPAFGAKGAVSGFKAEEARRDLFAASAERGSWSMTDMVRGRGAWVDERGRLILHCGEALWIDGRLEDTGEVGDHFYPRRPAAFLPWPEPVEDPADNPAVQLVEHLRTWNFVRGDIDVLLLLGFIGVGLMSGALDWRPSVFVVGDAGTGKSELLRVLKAVFGRTLISTTNTTEAGLYQFVGHDSLPIAIDELEGEDGQWQAQKIIKMARDAASGSVRIRGGADHKGVDFTARSAFLFSAINPPPIPPASLTRLAVLQLRELRSHDGAPPVIEAADAIGPKLLRRVADHWGEFERTYEAFATVLREQGGHNARGQKTFGTFLAAGALLLGDEGMEAAKMPWEKLEHYGLMLAADMLPELEGGQPNWRRCIEAILVAPIDAWSHGERKTVAEIIAWLRTNDNDVGFREAREKLSKADIGLVQKGAAGDWYALAVPNASKTLGKLLADTSFGDKSGDGNWQWALSQAPENVVRGKAALKRGSAPDNRVSIGGLQRRCRFVSLGDLPELELQEAAE